MENCLITKLKAAVNNPNLPILETMQQFTLDAITASGNSSMTDVQKWALNHFFYQIGAIDNNGVFAKTKYLFIPMICNSVKAKVLVNYKNNVVFPVSGFESYISFDEYGCIYKIGSRKTQPLTTNEDTDCDDFFFAGGYPVSAEHGTTVATFRVTSPTDIAYGATNENLGYTVAMNAQKLYYADAVPNYGFIGGRYDGTNAGIIVGTTANFTEPSSVSGTLTLPTSPYTLEVQLSPTPVGLLMWGSHLTEQEMTKLATAIREFVRNYCNI